MPHTFRSTHLLPAIAFALSCTMPSAGWAMTYQSAYSLAKAAFQGNAQSLATLQKFAGQGDPAAECVLGMYENTTHHAGKAAYWFQKAAAQGYAKAEFQIGYAYEFGLGVSQDYAKSDYWYRKAAEQGNVYAEKDLAEAYHLGKGVPQSMKQAIFWLKKAAAQGDPMAQETVKEYQEGVKFKHPLKNEEHGSAAGSK